jgi:hypothetical protein
VLVQRLDDPERRLDGFHRPGIELRHAVAYALGVPIRRAPSGLCDPGLRGS